MENVVWSENNFPKDVPAYIFTVNGLPKAALLVNESETTVASRMIYDVSDPINTVQYFPAFRSLVHQYFNNIDLTYLPHDERDQFLML